MAILGSKQRRQPRHIFLYLALFHHALFSENHLSFSTSCSISRPSGKAALIRTRRSRERGSGEWGNRHRKADSFAARRGRHTLHRGASAVSSAPVARRPAWPSAWELSGLFFVTECCSKPLSSPFGKMCVHLLKGRRLLWNGSILDIPMPWHLSKKSKRSDADGTENPWRFLILLPIQAIYLHIFQRSICR